MQVEKWYLFIYSIWTNPHYMYTNDFENMTENFSLKALVGLSHVVSYS